MSTHVRVVTMACLFLLYLAGCGAVRKTETAPAAAKPSSPIIGSWSSYDPGAEVIFSFGADNSMSCTVPDASEYSFTATYTVDLTTQPATLDLQNISAGSIPGASCLAIVRFPEQDVMEFRGNFGTPGQIARPADFSGGADLTNLYLRFTKRGQ